MSAPAVSSSARAHTARDAAVCGRLPTALPALWPPAKGQRRTHIHTSQHLNQPHDQTAAADMLQTLRSGACRSLRRSTSSAAAAAARPARSLLPAPRRHAAGFRSSSSSSSSSGSSSSTAARAMQIAGWWRRCPAELAPPRVRVTNGGVATFAAAAAATAGRTGHPAIQPHQPRRTTATRRPRRLPGGGVGDGLPQAAAGVARGAGLTAPQQKQMMSSRSSSLHIQQPTTTHHPPRRSSRPRATPSSRPRPAPASTRWSSPSPPARPLSPPTRRWSATRLCWAS
jgi:hypothetical protein